MRRTDQEFKAEVFRRRDVYWAKQRQRRKRLMTTALCVLLCVTTLWTIAPGFGGGTKETADNAAAEMAIGMMEPMEGADFSYLQEAPAEEAMQSTEMSLTASGSGSAAIELREEDAAVISGYLEGEWINDLTDCLHDCVLNIDGKQLRYHSDCGTFTDMENVRTLTVSEEDRIAINKILENYTELGFE